ncbi:MAG TPA: hypothetical protein VFR27_03085 [Mycobacterium sp.]|nr:hypothetical protein [Mycobacterium sp.]
MTTANLSAGGATMPTMATNSTVVGLVPAVPAPAWALPGAAPRHDVLVGDGSPITSWFRDFGDDVWLACEDTRDGDRLLRSESRIHHSEPPPDGLTAAQARELARQLMAAANALTDHDVNDGALR